MTTIQNATNTTGAQATANASGALSTASTDAQDRFLKLLVAQMQNQDPMNPLDNAQVTTQMAQISTVTGVSQLNATLKSMAAAFTSSQALQAAGVIGHDVLAPGSTLTLQNGAATAGVDLPGPADKVVVSILDSAGNVIHSVDLGSQQAGSLAFQWDGKTDSGATAANGVYSFKVDATQGGKSVKPTPLAMGQVGSVTLGANGAVLNVAGLGTVAMSDVKQIL
ncbi:MAG TPA: flagellar hook assembly protein FlgD [Betaproteobacteria bacterium]|nr:flagellar hook assembly protein FlgD [Betaproteobacteria bacterium]